MNAKPVLAHVARALRENGLEALLIGNAAAALHGAPLTTLDVDFLFRRTPTNLMKLRAVAKDLGAVIYKPHYPASQLLRLFRDEDSLQLDFMSQIHSASSYESLRNRAVTVEIDGEKLRIAALADIIESKRAAGRPRDEAVLHVLEATERQSREAEPRKGLGTTHPGKRTRADG